MKAVKTIPCESTGKPWILWPDSASKHGLPRAMYVVTETAQTREGDPQGTHDGLRDGAQRGRILGRVREYFYAHEWVDAGNPLPQERADTLDNRLLGAIFGTPMDTVDTQRAAFAAQAAARAEYAREQAEREQRKAERIAAEKAERLADEEAGLAAYKLLSSAYITLRDVDGIDIDALLGEVSFRWVRDHVRGTPAFVQAWRAIKIEGTADPERAADILAECLGVLEG